MRSKALSVLAVILLLVVVGLYLYRNHLLESAFEAAGTSLVGAKVEVDDLNLDVARLTVSLQRLQVTNPKNTWRNLFEFGTSRFQIEPEPLAWNRLVVREFSVENIRFNTRRRSDGAVPGAEGIAPLLIEQAQESLLSRLREAPAYDLTRLVNRKINIDSVLAVLEIGVVDSAAQLRQSLTADVGRWSTVLPGLDPRPRLAELQRLIAGIEPAKIQSVDELVNALDRVNQAERSIQTLKSEVDSIARSAESQLKQIRGQVARVDDWVRLDIRRARSKIGLPDLSPAGIAEMLFGRPVVDRVLGSIYWVGLARQAMPYVEKAEQIAKAGKVEKPPRGHGQDVLFPVRNRWPKWLIRRIFLSAAPSMADTSSGWRASGEVTGLTSHPPVYGRPATFDIRAQVPGGARLALAGILDHTQEVATDRFELAASGLRLGDVWLVEIPYFPNRLTLERLDANLRFQLAGEELDLGVRITAPKALFRFPDAPGGNPRVARLIREVFAGLGRLELEAGIRGVLSDLSLSVRSNIDDALSERIRSLVGTEVEKAQREVERRLMAMADRERQKLLAWYGKEAEPLVLRAQEYRRLVAQRDRMLADLKTELTARIEQEKKEAERKLGEEAKKKLKELIKKP